MPDVVQTPSFHGRRHGEAASSDRTVLRCLARQSVGCRRMRNRPTTLRRGRRDCASPEGCRDRRGRRGHLARVNRSRTTTRQDASASPGVVVPDTAGEPAHFAQQVTRFRCPRPGWALHGDAPAAEGRTGAASRHERGEVGRIRRWFRHRSRQRRRRRAMRESDARDQAPVLRGAAEDFRGWTADCGPPGSPVPRAPWPLVLDRLRHFE